jgi:hypothetical protein
MSSPDALTKPVDQFKDRRLCPLVKNYSAEYDACKVEIYCSIDLARDRLQ